MKHSRKLILNRAFPGSVALLFTALSCVSATASADEPVFTMTTIIDSAHGAEIAAGKYQQAIEKIAVIDNDVDAFFNNTNLCVAYTKTGSLDDALFACSAAVEQADGISFYRLGYLSRSFKERRRSEYLAMALSNRGVLRAAMGDVELARQDFVEALSVRARSSVAKTNLVRLDKVGAKKV